MKVWLSSDSFTMLLTSINTKVYLPSFPYAPSIKNTIINFESVLTCIYMFFRLCIPPLPLPPPPPRTQERYISTLTIWVCSHYHWCRWPLQYCHSAHCNIILSIYLQTTNDNWQITSVHSLCVGVVNLWISDDVIAYDSIVVANWGRSPGDLDTCGVDKRGIDSFWWGTWCYVRV